MLKRRKVIIVLLMFSFLLLCAGRVIVYGFAASEHDKRMWKVLTGKDKPVFKNKEVKEAIENASYLCVDQYNNNGSNKLSQLKEVGVKGLPDSISEINYNAVGDTHRMKTHSGWNYNVSMEFAEKWEKRKTILINTAGKIFDFEGNTVKQEAFCKLIYYTHIIGDYEYNDPFEDDGLMPLGGKFGKKSVISELLVCIKDLFENQHTSYYYIFLKLDLELLDARLYRLYNTYANMNESLRGEKYYKYINDLEKMLYSFIPKLLKNEDFFNEVYDFN